MKKDRWNSQFENILNADNEKEEVDDVLHAQVNKK